MKYYTQCQAYPEGQPFVFKVWLDYDEAIDNVQMLFRLCDIRHIDIVEHTTNKTFITLHKLKNDLQDERKTTREEQKCEVF